MAGTIRLGGAVDLHSHVGPSKFPRRVTGYEYAREAAEADMDAVVMKEHYLPTAYGTEYIDQLLAVDDADIEVRGSVVMNYCNGGFNPFMVQTAIDYGAAVVWAPTIDARNHGEKTAGVGMYLGVEEVPPEYEGKTGLYALDDDGNLTEDVELCIEKVAENDVILAIGHVSNEETFAMTEYAASLGHDKIMIDHPNFEITDLDRDQQKELVTMGATLNFPWAGMSPKFQWTSPKEVYDNVRDVGVDNCVVSSDVGQPQNPSSPEALRIYGELLLEQGLSVDEYRVLVEENPKALLGLD